MLRKRWAVRNPVVVEEDVTQVSLEWLFITLWLNVPMLSNITSYQHVLYYSFYEQECISPRQTSFVRCFSSKIVSKNVFMFICENIY